MNSISEQLLQAVEVVVDEKVSKLNYDKTVQAKIYSIINLDIGEYKVRYNGNIFSAFVSDLSHKYKIDDQVYVNIPEGDFSNRKIIISKVTDQSLSQSQLAALKNSIVEISPSLESIYNLTFDQPIGVVAGAPSESEKGHAYVLKDTGDMSNGLFLQYAKNYENIRIRASFLTQFHEIHSKGNYGIEVEFYTNDNSVVPYRLDFQNFNGYPYSFSVYAEQEVVIKVQKGYLTGLKSVKLFQEDFAYDRTSKYVLDEMNQVFVQYTEIQDTPNIFVKDVSIQYVEVKDLSDSAYHLFISPLKGLAFSEQVTSLSLLGRLVYEGEDIIEQADSCQWYVRDLSVVVGSEHYNKDVGVGWRSLDGQISNRLDIDISEVVKQEKYKLLVLYNDTVLTAEAEVFNLTNKLEYALEQVTKEEQRIFLQIDNETLVGDWYVLYPDGAYQAVENGTYVRSVDITPYLKYETVTFYVTVYSDGVRQGTLEYTIMAAQDEEDVIVTYSGQDIYRYDANGDITIEDSEKERTLQAVLTWKEGFAAGYTVAWAMEDGTEIPGNKEEGLKPSKSMLSDLWVDNYGVLHYNLKQKYRLDYNNNTLLLKVKTYVGQEYTFQKEILCLKDGDQGTNGTTYVTAIRPCEASGTKLSGFQALRYNNGWSDTMNLRCYVYKDGELINSNPLYTIDYRWRGHDILINDQEDYKDSTEQVVVRYEGDLPARSAFYIKVQVDIMAESGEEITIYASYPIDILVGAIDKAGVDISDIPSYVKYTASGVNPSYYNNELLFYYNETSYNTIRTLTDSLLLIEERDGVKRLKPTSSFIYENIKNDEESNIGVLELSMDDQNSKIIHPIIMYLDTYGNEAINGWDGTALELDGEGQYIFAPQVGAGVKTSDNRFTGVVMGKDSTQELIGLYGYQDGVNTFGLMENGTAFFGAKSGGGQITIDGNEATLSGGGGGDSYNGVTITLANLTGEDDTKAIKIGGGNFSVAYDGTMEATGAVIEGEIYAQRGRIGCTSRNSTDGWTIEPNRLYSGSGSKHVELNSGDSDFAFWAGSESGDTAKSQKFAVSKEGDLYAHTGIIGGWYMQNNFLAHRENKVGMSANNQIAFWAGETGVGAPGDSPKNPTFQVSQDGKLVCSEANISGYITATTLSCNNGQIGGWTISSNGLEAGKVKLYSSGNSIIGGWTIGDSFLSGQGGNVKLNSEGNALVWTTYGYLGMIAGDINGSTTTNFGMDTTSATASGDRSIILNAGSNIKLSGKSIYLDAEDEVHLQNTQELILSPNLYGDSLPNGGYEGMIFFLIE